MTIRIFWALAITIFVLCSPILIITTSVKFLVLNPGFYDSNQATNGVLSSSGFPATALQAANKSLTAYFGDRDTSLDGELKKQGLPADFFNQRESAHLADVKDLIWTVIAAQQMTLGYVLLFLAANVLFKPRRFLQAVRGPLAWGAGLTLAVLVVFGILSQIDFSGIFLMFHLVSFSNDLWMLDPRTDNLLKLFPQVFWLHSAATMAVYSALGALGIGAVGALLHWRRLGLT